MWVITPRGFYSAVQDKADPETIVVRARVHADLAALCKMVPRKVKIIDNEGTDYPFRIRLSRAEWTQAAMELAAEIDYTNVKNAVAERQGHDRAAAYSRIWGVLLGLEQRFNRRRRWRGDRHDDVPFGDFDWGSVE